MDLVEDLAEPEVPITLASGSRASSTQADRSSGSAIHADLGDHATKCPWISGPGQGSVQSWLDRTVGIMRSLKVVSSDLAAAHRKADSATTTIKFFPGAKQGEVCILEVSSTAPTTGEIMPFRFGPDPANGVDYPSVVILVSPSEWQDIQKSKLPLPNGWDLATAEDL